MTITWHVTSLNS